MHVCQTPRSGFCFVGVAGVSLLCVWARLFSCTLFTGFPLCVRVSWLAYRPIWYSTFASFHAPFCRRVLMCPQLGISHAFPLSTFYSYFPYVKKVSLDIIEILFYFQIQSKMLVPMMLLRSRGDFKSSFNLEKTVFCCPHSISFLQTVCTVHDELPISNCS